MLFVQVAKLRIFSSYGAVWAWQKMTSWLSQSIQSDFLSFCIYWIKFGWLDCAFLAVDLASEMDWTYDLWIALWPNLWIAICICCPRFQRICWPIAVASKLYAVQHKWSGTSRSYRFGFYCHSTLWTSNFLCFVSIFNLLFLFSLSVILKGFVFGPDWAGRTSWHHRGAQL